MQIILDEAIDVLRHTIEAVLRIAIGFVQGLGTGGKWGMRFVACFFFFCAVGIFFNTDGLEANVAAGTFAVLGAGLWIWSNFQKKRF